MQNIVPMVDEMQIVLDVLRYVNGDGEFNELYTVNFRDIDSVVVAFDMVGMATHKKWDVCFYVSQVSGGIRQDLPSSKSQHGKIEICDHGRALHLGSYSNSLSHRSAWTTSS